MEEYNSMKHLDDVHMNYFQHLGLACLNSMKLLVSSVALFIHAFLPFVFVKTASGIVKNVHKSFLHQPKDRILIRFNTKWQSDPNNRQWRVLVNGVETLVHIVIIDTKCTTIEEPVDGEQKFHFLCNGHVTFEGTEFLMYAHIS